MAQSSFARIAQVVPSYSCARGRDTLMAPRRLLIAAPAPDQHMRYTWVACSIHTRCVRPVVSPLYGSLASVLLQPCPHPLDPPRRGRVDPVPRGDLLPHP